MAQPRLGLSGLAFLRIKGFRTTFVSTSRDASVEKNSFTHRKIPMENGQRTMRHGFIIHSPQEEIILHEQRFHFSHHHQCSSHRGEGISHTDLQVLPTSGFVPTARNGRFIPTCRHGVSNRTDFKGTFAFHDFPVIGRYPFQVLTSLPLSGTGTH